MENPALTQVIVAQVAHLASRFQDGAASADVLHLRQLHARLPFQFSGDRNQSLSPLRYDCTRVKAVRVSTQRCLECIQRETMRRAPIVDDIQGPVPIGKFGVVPSIALYWVIDFRLRYRAVIGLD